MAKIRADFIGDRENQSHININDIMVNYDALINKGLHRPNIKMSKYQDSLIYQDFVYIGLKGALPYVTTGNWEIDKDFLRLVSGINPLRQVRDLKVLAGNYALAAENARDESIRQAGLSDQSAANSEASKVESERQAGLSQASAVASEASKTESTRQAGLSAGSALVSSQQATISTNKAAEAKASEVEAARQVGLATAEVLLAKGYKEAAELAATGSNDSKDIATQQAGIATDKAQEAIDTVATIVPTIRASQEFLEVVGSAEIVLDLEPTSNFFIVLDQDGLIKNPLNLYNGATGKILISYQATNQITFDTFWDTGAADLSSNLNPAGGILYIDYVVVSMDKIYVLAYSQFTN